jgi:hypothetical protein
MAWLNEGGVTRWVTRKKDGSRAVAKNASTSPGVSAIGASDNDPLQEVVVTASKRADDIKDVPMSITAISGADLADSRKSTPNSRPILFVCERWESPSRRTFSEHAKYE